MTCNRNIGWMIIATDAARGITTSGPPHPNLNTAVRMVRWPDLDDQAVPPQRSSAS